MEDGFSTMGRGYGDLIGGDGDRSETLLGRSSFLAGSGKSPGRQTWGSDSMGDVHRCDLLPEDLQTSAIPWNEGARGLGKLFCTGRARHEPTS